MIFNRQINDEILLQETPEKLVSKYLNVVRKLIHKFWKKLNPSNSELEIIEEIIVKRLPIRLTKWQSKAEGETYALTLLMECTQILCNDVLDLQLLRKKSPKLILKYVSYISARVDYLTNTNYFKSQDAADVLQWVQHRLLERLRKGSFDSFESKEGTLFRTYLYRVVKNLFTDARRSLYQTQKNQQQLELKSALLAGKSEVGANPFELFSDEQSQKLQLRRLRQIFLLYAVSTRIKFELCLKGSYCLLITEDEVSKLALSQKDTQKMLSFFGADYQHVSMGLVWRELSGFISLWEGKNLHPDTLRKWFTRQRNQIIAKLLALTMIDRELGTGNSIEQQSKFLLHKINTNRTVAKYAVEWLGDIAYTYYLS